VAFSLVLAKRPLKRAAIALALALDSPDQIGQRGAEKVELHVQECTCVCVCVCIHSGVLHVNC